MYTNVMFMWLVPPAIGCGSILIACLVAAILYKLIRPKFPVHVSCWFCSFDTLVPYGNRNCWDCPQCEQYNGFTQDGDYNKPIPAQVCEDLNHPVKCRPEEYIGSRSSLCLECQQNQLLRVKQLAAFTPINEEMFESEIEAYERHVENEYQLCADCERRVERELHKQNDILRPSLHGTKFDNSAVSDYSDFNISQREDTRGCWNCGVAASRAVGLIAWLISSGLLASHYVSNIASRIHGMSTLTDNLSDILRSHHLTHSLVGLVADHQLMLCVAGFVLSFISKVLLGRGRLSLVDRLDCLTWLMHSLGYMSPRWVPLPDNVLSVVTATNFITSLTSVLSSRKTKKMYFTRVSLDQSEIQATQSDIFPLSSHDPATHLPSQDTELLSDADDLDLTFNAMSVDPLACKLKRNDSGMFSSTTSLNSLSSLSRVSNSGEPRPLITPAKLGFLNSSHILAQAKSDGYVTQQAKNLVNNDLPQNLFQASLEMNSHYHLFDKQYMQKIPSLKPSCLISTQFHNLSNKQDNTNNSCPGGNESATQNPVGTGNMFAQNPVSHGNVFAQNPMGQGKMFAQNPMSPGKMFAQNPVSQANMFNQSMMSGIQMPQLDSNQGNMNQNHCTTNRLLHQTSHLDTAGKRTSSFPPLWNCSKSQFPSKTFTEHSNFSTKNNDHFSSMNNYYSNSFSGNKVICPTFPDNPFSGIKKKQTSTRNTEFGFGGKTCSYDNVAMLRKSLDLDNVFQSTESCAVDSTSVVDTTVKKGSMWSAVCVGFVISVSLLLNVCLMVYYFTATSK